MQALIECMSVACGNASERSLRPLSCENWNFELGLTSLKALTDPE
jgi:hypothetical protein